MSTVDLNLNNVEELIFRDKKCRDLLPDFKDCFRQWQFAVTTPGFGALGKRTLIDFLNDLTSEHIVVLCEYFGTRTMSVDKLNYHTILNYEFNLEGLDTELNRVESFQNFSLSRDESRVYISFWR
jgi:hypothetical protein